MVMIVVRNYVGVIIHDFHVGHLALRADQVAEVLVVVVPILRRHEGRLGIRIMGGFHERVLSIVTATRLVPPAQRE